MEMNPRIGKCPPLFIEVTPRCHCSFASTTASDRAPGSWPRSRSWVWGRLGFAAPSVVAGSGPTLLIEVDAHDLPRRLLHTRIHVPCQPGKLGLWYPKWIPGTHSPSGPIQDVAGLRLETTDGKAVPWRRNDSEVFKVECDVPDGVHEIIARLDVICNGPAVEASGHLSYGNNSVGMINWSTCLLYPDGPSCDDIMANLSLRLPRGWRFATALKPESPGNGRDQKPAGDGATAFKTVTLNDLLDNPLIAGEHLRTIPLDAGKNPPAFMHLVSESPTALKLGPNVIDLYSRMVREAGALFGACHYPEFHFLVTCSDDLGYHGLEHLACSINGVRERDLIEDSRRKGWVANLIPHEYVHSWCGKYRRPAGMCTADYQTPLKTRLLWVYEGLTEYLGEVLMVRSGLVDPKEYRETLTATIGSLAHQEGRRWRPLEDTAAASYLLRGHSAELARAQARAGLLLRGGLDLAGGRRHHSRTLGRKEKPRRLLPEVPWGQPDRCLGRSL